MAANSGTSLRCLITNPTTAKTRPGKQTRKQVFYGNNRGRVLAQLACGGDLSFEHSVFYLLHLPSQCSKISLKEVASIAYRNAQSESRGANLVVGLVHLEAQTHACIEVSTISVWHRGFGVLGCVAFLRLPSISSAVYPFAYSITSLLV